MSPSAIVRAQARLTLKGNYVAAVAAFAILLLPVYINQGLSYVIGAFLMAAFSDAVLIGALGIIILTPLSIIVGVLLSPLFNGYIRLFYQAALTKQFDMKALFYYFQKGKYQKTLLLNLSFLVRIMLPAILCFLPLFLYEILCYSFFQGFTETVLFKDFSFILSILSMILLILYAMKYFVLFTLYCTDEDEDIRELFIRSKRIMKHQKSAATSLFFSFTPWMLLCILILPALYVVPYMTQSLCIGAKWMTMKGQD